MIEFKWNGVKESGRKLVRCSYSDGELTNHPAGTLTIYAKDYGTDGHFGPAMCAAFAVQNDTDSQTDYFETDRIRVVPTHPLYGQVKAAMEAHKAHRARINQRRNANANAMRDLGVVRVRGALGGTYWEWCTDKATPAPELLAAPKDCAEYFSDFVETDYTAANLQRTALNAIAKAEGR